MTSRIIDSRIPTARYVFLLAAGLALPAAAVAHHSRFVFDTSELVEVQGTIESVFWRNPHVMISVRGTGESGAEAVYELEAGPVNALERAGIFEDAVVIGASVTVLGFASQRDEHDMQPVRLDYSDGSNVTLSDEWAVRLGMLDDAHERAAIDPGQVARAIEEADGLFRVWVNTGRTYIDRNLPLRPEAQAAKDSWDQPSDDVALRCEPAGLPEAMVSPFPIELIDNGNDTITVRLEEWDNVRTIYMNPETAPAGPRAQPAGPLGGPLGRGGTGGDHQPHQLPVSRRPRHASVGSRGNRRAFRHERGRDPPGLARDAGGRQHVHGAGAAAGHALRVGSGGTDQGV